jgi:hypothetical protein
MTFNESALGIRRLPDAPPNAFARAHFHAEFAFAQHYDLAVGLWPLPFGVKRP